MCFIYRKAYQIMCVCVDGWMFSPWEVKAASPLARVQWLGFSLPYFRWPLPRASAQVKPMSHPSHICANARARSDRCPDSKQSSKHSAAERRDFATQLVSSLIEGTADERFPGAVSLWLEGTLATPQERRPHRLDKMRRKTLYLTLYIPLRLRSCVLQK